MRHEITGVTEGSVAEKHGFLAGDVFISVNGSLSSTRSIIRLSARIRILP